MSTSPTTRERTTSDEPDGAGPSPSRIVLVILGLSAALSVVLVAFAWPNVASEPRQIPVVVSGPAEVTETLEARMEEALGEDAVDLTEVADLREAEAAVLEREAYGALVLGPEGGEMVIASAASPVVAQGLQQIAAAVPPEMGGPLAVRDLVALPERDARGMGLPSAVLPLLLAGYASGVVAALHLRGRVAVQLAAIAGVAAISGLSFAGIMQGWFESLGGNYWANSGVLALGIAAVGVTVAGLYRLWGLKGSIGMVVAMVLLGNPLSGAMSAPEMLPAGWGAFGQLLPPGALVSALRSVAFFDGAGSVQPWIVLSAWVAAGLLLILFAPSREPEASSRQQM